LFTHVGALVEFPKNQIYIYFVTERILNIALNKGKFKKIEDQICFSHIYTKFSVPKIFAGPFSIA